MQTIRSNPDVKGFTLIEVMVVTVIIVLVATMALPSFTRMNNNAQVERVVQQLQMEEQALRQYAIFNRGYPSNAVAAVLPTTPATLQEYLPAGFNWTNSTPLGGNWKWEANAKANGFYFEYGISISKLYNPLWSPKLFLQVDQRIDDGNLSTGAFRSNNIAGNNSVYSYALQYTNQPWGTAQ